MPRRPAPPADTGPTPRQLWLAAQRLAAGDEPALAAAMAGIPCEALIERIDADPHFHQLLHGCERVAALDHEAREERLRLMVQDACERLLMDGNAALAGRLLRSHGIGGKPGRREAVLIQANQNLLRLIATITWEEFQQMRSMGSHAQAAANDTGAARAVG